MLARIFSRFPRKFAWIAAALVVLAVGTAPQARAQDLDGGYLPSPGILPPLPTDPQQKALAANQYTSDRPSQASYSSNQSNQDWKVEISPGRDSEDFKGKSYQAVYNSIPFRRAEYLANPSYRHDATMEILFGQMRPTVINKTDTPQRVVNPRPELYQPYPFSRGEFFDVIRAQNTYRINGLNGSPFLNPAIVP